MSIPINIETLLSGKIVEGARMEFKEGWNPKTIMRTVCAFANDFDNVGSGYIIVGVEEDNGKPVRPLKGFDPNAFEKVQKELIGYCNLMEPPYAPRISLEEIDNKYVLVIWATAGSVRPYRVPDDVTVKNKKLNFRIRQFSSSVVPNKEQEMELIQLTSRIPFDDRANALADFGDLDLGLMREHLAQIKSKLYDESKSMNEEELAIALNLCDGAREHLFPRNIGLLMFSKHPKKYFPTAQIDVVEFPNGIAGKNFNEKIFEGPIQRQLTDALAYFKAVVIKEKVIKHSHTEIADRIYNYPYQAIEEALANAVYHKNYEIREPIEVRIFPDKIEIISHNGVDPSIKQSDFDKGIVRIRRYRNRRIGNFLKELGLTEGRGTGIPTMKQVLDKNGSASAIFETDEPDRRYFICTIPIHDAFLERKSSTDEYGQLRPIANDYKRLRTITNDYERLSKPQKDILLHLLDNQNITRKNASELIGLKNTKTYEILTEMLGMGLLEKHAQGRSTFYTLIRKEN